MIPSVKKFYKLSWVQHLLFWAVSFYFIGSYFSISNVIGPIDIIYSGCFHISIAVLVYINLRILIPRLLTRKSVFLYIVLSIMTVALALLTHELTFELLIPALPWEYYLVSFTDPWVLITIFSCYLVLSSLIKLSKSWFKLQQLEALQKDMELRSLKLQVNPHFLLNSLNSIYGLSLTGTKEVPEYIIKLSNILKHILYETKKEHIPLSEEITYIEDYIALQKIRLPKETDVRFITEGKADHLYIAPMLIIPFIENAFKHGAGGEGDRDYAHFKLTLAGDRLQFISRNNQGSSNEIKDSEYSGIGLENIRKRLEFLYPGKHDLKITSNAYEFTAQLDLALK